jgi:hypothetical protein
MAVLGYRIDTHSESDKKRPAQSFSIALEDSIEVNIFWKSVIRIVFLNIWDTQVSPHNLLYSFTLLVDEGYIDYIHWHSQDGIST